MNKSLIFLSFIAVLISYFNVFGSDVGPKVSAETKPTSKSVLKKYVNRPVTNELYRQVQIENLSTIIDHRLYNLLSYEDPIISQVTPEIIQVLKQQSESAMINELTQKSLVSADSNKDIHKMVTTVMTSLGFSDTQIKNTRVYIAYDVRPNAYTYGADKNNVVIIINNKLLEKASKGEIMGVIGHELGHVLKQHVLQGIQLNLMINRIATIALETHPLDKSTSMTNFENKIDEIFLNIETKRVQESNKEMSQADARTVATNKMEQTRQARKALSKKLQYLYSNTDPQIVVNSAQSFLFEMVRAIETIEVPQETKEFFIKLAQDLSTSYRPNIEDLITHIGVLSGVISREQETTSDLFGASIVDPSNSVRFDLKVAGGAGLADAPTRSEVKAAVANLEKQLNEVKKLSSKEDLAINLAGSGESHPRHNIRAVNQVYLSRHFQNVMMRNPFLRLVALRNKLEKYTNIYDDNVLMAFSEKTKLSYTLATRSFLNPWAVNQTLFNFEAQMRENSEALGIFKAPYDEITKDVLDLIKELGFNGQNPRLNNLIDYEINVREFREALIAYYNTAISTAKSPQQRQRLQEHQQGVLKVMQEPSSLVQELLKIVPKDSTTFKRLTLINPNTDLPTLIKLRSEIRIETKSENRLSRADSDISLNWRKSSSLKTRECVTALSSLLQPGTHFNY